MDNDRQSTRNRQAAHHDANITDARIRDSDALAGKRDALSKLGFKG